jgi:hypothetical protein
MHIEPTTTNKTGQGDGTEPHQGNNEKREQRKIKEKKPEDGSNTSSWSGKTPSPSEFSLCVEETPVAGR